MIVPAEREWHCKEVDQKLIKKICSETGISSFLCTLLFNRGLKDISSIRKFIKPKFSDLHDPMLLPDMDKSVDRIRKAFNDREKIMVYGDYDCDGTTSITVLKNALDVLGMKEVGYYVPNRFSEGYGLNKEAITEFAKQGYTLMITVDCGVTAIEQVEYANFLGIDVIVTDHHLPDADRLPNALALICPHAVENDYPYKSLAGVGLAFKLASAIVDNDEYLYSLLDIVTLGTIVDVAPLTGENRTITKLGLDLLNNRDIPKRPGIQALCSICGHLGNHVMTGYDFSFQLGPRVNAAGRMGRAETVVELLTENSHKKAEVIAKQLNQMNTDRKKYQNQIYKEAVQIIEKEDLHKDNAIVVANDWGINAKGVVGIVASQLMETYNKPVVLLTVNEDKASGSGRSDDAINLSDALLECSDVLLTHGGHAAAAGLSLDKKDIDEFRDKLNLYAQENIDAKEVDPGFEFDYELDFTDINETLLREIELLQPCGHKNKYPLIRSSQVKLPEGTEYHGQTKEHLRFTAEQNGSSIKGLQWRSGHYKKTLDTEGQYYSMCYYPELQSYRGRRNLRISIQDWKICDTEDQIKEAKDNARSLLMSMQYWFLEEHNIYVKDVYNAFQSMKGTDPETWSSKDWNSFTKQLNLCKEDPTCDLMGAINGN